MRDLALRSKLAATGIHFPDTAVLMKPEWRGDLIGATRANPSLGLQMQLGMDAQPQTVTATSAGIPGFLTNIVDPEVIRVVTLPSKFAEIFGEDQKGDWTVLSTTFPIVENVGSTASYGDFNNNGNLDANGNWVPRQSFRYQTVKRYGERTTAMWGVAGINYSAELDRSAAYVFSRVRNRSYAFGIRGLQNYGMLNDPSLIAPSTPATKSAGGVSWLTATADEEYRDVLALYGQLLAQMGNNIDRNTPMVLVMSPGREALLGKLSAFNISARAMIQANFPNLKIVTIPEYSTTGGELMQLILPTYQGQKTAYLAYTDLLKTHPLVQMMSSIDQKMSAGTWGAIIRRPLAIAQQLGI
jgi:hypothetical protein